MTDKSPLLITETAALEAFCARLAQSRYIAVDTEFMREKTYWPKLCLVQLADAHGAAAVDPLSPDLSLAPLMRLMALERVLKVFHAARQDIEIFVQLTGGVPRPLFDTQIAAMVLGFGDSVAYDGLAQRLAKVHIDKALRFTDWSRRPLTDKQVRYALDDVIHLRTVFEKLEARLEKTGRAAWIAEEMATLTDPSTYRAEPEEAWRRLKPRTQNRRHLAVFKAVAAWREREAQRLDIPRRRVLRDEALPEIAAAAPRDRAALERIRGLGSGALGGGLSDTLLAAIGAAMALADEALPKPEKPEKLPNNIGPLVELLKVLLKANCEAAGVASRLVATVEDLERIAAAAVQGRPLESPLLSGWRFDLFGKDALALATGRSGLALQSGRVRLVPLAPGAEAAEQKPPRPAEG